MILFQRAHFENFRMLRDLTLEFATSREKPLTVIRGENESGKTTVLWAMQWAFWGDAILPSQGRNFRLHPVDWDASEGRCAISVEITFETESDDEGTGGPARRYTVHRQCVEEVGADDFQRGEHTLQLYEITDSGTTPKPQPELFLAAMFPRELREVFFTDGARVLSFTGSELSQTTKRKRVQDAIRALLGIDLLEDARDHVKWVQSEINSELKVGSADAPLNEIAGAIEGIESELAEQVRLQAEAVSQIAEIEDMYSQTTGRLEAALAKGDREQLGQDLARVEREIAGHKETVGSCKRKRSLLFRHEGLAAGLLRASMEEALEKLSDLRERNLIPRNFLPVLEQRLALGTCICGTMLPAGGEHRAHLMQMVEEQKSADDTSSRLSDLVPAARRYAQFEQTGSVWMTELTDLWRIQATAEAGLRDAQGRHKALDVQLKAVGDTDVVMFRAQKRELLAQKDGAVAKKTRAETSTSRLKRELEEKRQQRGSYMKLRDKFRKQRAELDATQDVLVVLEQAYGAIQATKITQVSERMNSSFLEMIGSSEERGIIQHAEIDSEFDIIVHGPMRRVLDPDRDLNGASRRALTLAFIVALTTVSGVTAPSVIDTPISELSGGVRREVLRIVAAMSRQLILFLTRADIREVEDVLDEYAGQTITITNSTHYPEFLVNDCGEGKARALSCECSHREYCSVCERRGDDGEIALHSRGGLVRVVA
jgi:DNA sulfur modification protein DndD